MVHGIHSEAEMVRVVQTQVAFVWVILILFCTTSCGSMVD